MKFCRFIGDMPLATSSLKEYTHKSVTIGAIIVHLIKTNSYKNERTVPKALFGDLF